MPFGEQHAIGDPFAQVDQQAVSRLRRPQVNIVDTMRDALRAYSMAGQWNGERKSGQQLLLDAGFTSAEYLAHGLEAIATVQLPQPHGAAA